MGRWGAEFDPDRLADLETAMWKAYYRRQPARLFGYLLLGLREQAHASWPRALAASFFLTRAAAGFARSTDEYDRFAPDVARGYRLLGLPPDVDAEEVARRELPRATRSRGCTPRSIRSPRKSSPRPDDYEARRPRSATAAGAPTPRATGGAASRIGPASRRSSASPTESSTERSTADSQDVISRGESRPVGADRDTDSCLLTVTRALGRGVVSYDREAGV
jgi:hypothetical protein